MKEAGLITLVDPGADKPLLETATLRCCHCGGHFPASPTKGRGWCRNCAGPICGAGCLACVHWEQLLENLEAGRPLDFKPVVVPVFLHSED